MAKKPTKSHPSSTNWAAREVGHGSVRDLFPQYAFEHDAAILFSSISKQIGEEEARRIFEAVAARPPKPPGRKAGDRGEVYYRHLAYVEDYLMKSGGRRKLKYHTWAHDNFVAKNQRQPTPDDQKEIDSAVRYLKASFAFLDEHKQTEPTLDDNGRRGFYDYTKETNPDFKDEKIAHLYISNVLGEEASPSRIVEIVQQFQKDSIWREEADRKRNAEFD